MGLKGFIVKSDCGATTGCMGGSRRSAAMSRAKAKQVIDFLHELSIKKGCDPGRHELVEVRARYVQGVNAPTRGILGRERE